MKNIFKLPLAMVLASSLAVSTSLQANTIEPKEERQVTENLEKLNINSATADALIALPGIGKRKAQAIVEYRETHGNFLIIEDIQNVRGIGKKLFAKLQTRISV